MLMFKKVKSVLGDGLDWFYTNTVKTHFFKPVNIITTDEDERDINARASGMGQVGSPQCGDVMKVWVVVKDNRIAECKWKTFGCASAIASTSMMSVIVTENNGMTVDEAYQLKPTDILTRLGGLPAIKVHCSVLGDQALRESIDDYRDKKANITN